jgi:hypothetical protein
VSWYPRLTVRARLTLLYTCLFAFCGAIVVAVSYTLVARLEPQGQTQQAPASFLARCRSEQLSAHPNGRLVAKCNAYFQLPATRLVSLALARRGGLSRGWQPEVTQAACAPAGRGTSGPPPASGRSAAGAMTLRARRIRAPGPPAG